jgi:phosphate-selective porin
MHVLQENADRNGLRSIRCGTQGASQRNVKVAGSLDLRKGVRCGLPLQIEESIGLSLVHFDICTLRTLQMKMQLEANATYYVVMDGLSSSPGDSLGSLSIETLRVPVWFPPSPNPIHIMPFCTVSSARRLD